MAAPRKLTTPVANSQIASREWLPEAKRAASSRTMLTIFALIAGLIGAGVGLFFGLASGLRFGLLFGLLFGLGGWLFSRWIGRVAEPSRADAMVWSWALAYRGLAFGMGGVLLGVGLVRVGLLTLFWPLCVGLVSRRVRRVIGRLAVRLLSGRVARLIVRPGVWLVSGLVRSGLGLRSNLGDLGVALLAGLEYGLLLELNTFSVQKRTTGNGGFKQSALYAAVVLLSCLALAGALAGLMPRASAAPFCGYFCHLPSIPQGRRVLSQASRHALRADSIEVDSGAL